MLKYFRGFFVLCTFLLIIGSLQFITNNPFAKETKNELNIYIYSDFFDKNMVDEFEEETGIKVNLHYYSTNEELLAKLNYSQYDSYDLLFLADYASSILAKKGALLPIDKSRINFLDKVYPFLLDKPFDRGNIYSLPYMWECTGIGYNEKFLQPEEVSLDLFFNSPCKKVTTNDPIETINLAAEYILPNKKDLDEKDKQAISDTLHKQKDTIEAYAEFRAKDLIIGENVPLALIKTPFFPNLTKVNNSIKFDFPKEGIFTSIENVVFLKDSENVDNAYAFINFIYKPENLAKTTEHYPCFPACKEAFRFINLDKDFEQLIDKVEKREKDMRFFHYIIDKEEAHKIFIETKS